MAKLAKLSRTAKMEAAIDYRLLDLWSELSLGLPKEHIEFAGACLRAAYAKGYVDSHKEEGEMIVELGYKLPEKT